MEKVKGTSGAIGYIELGFTLTDNSVGVGHVQNASGKYVAATQSSIAAAYHSAENLSRGFRASLTNVSATMPIRSSASPGSTCRKIGRSGRSRALGNFLEWALSMGEQSANNTGTHHCPRRSPQSSRKNSIRYTNASASLLGLAARKTIGLRVTSVFTLPQTSSKAGRSSVGQRRTVYHHNRMESSQYFVPAHINSRTGETTCPTPRLVTSSKQCELSCQLSRDEELCLSRTTEVRGDGASFPRQILQLLRPAVIEDPRFRPGTRCSDGSCACDVGDAVPSFNPALVSFRCVVPLLP